MQAREAGRDAEATASQLGFRIIFQEPNLEGLLIRLHEGFKHKKVKKGTEGARLQKLWPGHSKPPTTNQLIRRFRLDDLRRAAQHDAGLRQLVCVLGLWFPGRVGFREWLLPSISMAKLGNPPIPADAGEKRLGLQQQAALWV